MGEVRVREIIEASPEAVWAVLSDIGGWATWTDVMVDGRCDRPEPGGVIAFRLRIGPGLPVKARLLDWEPGRAFAWGEERGRIVRIVHGFELEPMGSATRVTHYERFGGVVGRAVWPVIRRSLFRAYPAFLSDLKRRVERPE